MPDSLSLRRTPRIDVLDVVRGIAILLIFFFNIPAMGNSNYSHFGALKLLGWSLADKVCWCLLNVMLEGTQRGLLELLFGAGALLLLRNTLHASGSISDVDHYFRRNLWLMVFGAADIFGLLWFGDILLPYGFVALFLFPFRKLSARALLALCFSFVLATVVQGSVSFRSDTQDYAEAQQAARDQAHNLPLNQQEQHALAARTDAMAIFHIPAAQLQEEREARLGPVKAYIHAFHEIWLKDVLLGGYLPIQLLEAFFSMLLGMALFKLGIIQGEKSRRFYLMLTLLCYIPGLAERAYGTWQQIQFQALPNIETITGPAARLAVTVGHLSLINLLMKTQTGGFILRIFKAPGRTAFSLYLMQNVFGCWVLFPGFALGLWGRYGWFGLSMLALGFITAQLLLANAWMKVFAMGPLEWVWRSLAYQHLQPFRHKADRADPITL